MDKLVASAAEAVGDVPSGASLAVGGFGLCGIPSVLIGALSGTGAEDLEVVSNNCGADGPLTADCLGVTAPTGRSRWPHRPSRRPSSSWAASSERTCILEHAIVTDFALVRAWKGDRPGNLVFHRAARNFNPLAAMAGRVTIAEVEHFFEAGELDPDEIHLPGVFVQGVVALTPAQAAGKRIEKPTTRGKRSLSGAHSGEGTGG